MRQHKTRKLWDFAGELRRIGFEVKFNDEEGYLIVSRRLESYPFISFMHFDYSDIGENYGVKEIMGMFNVDLNSEGVIYDKVAKGGGDLNMESREFEAFYESLIPNIKKGRGGGVKMREKIWDSEVSGLDKRAVELSLQRQKILIMKDVVDEMLDKNTEDLNEVNKELLGLVMRKK